MPVTKGYEGVVNPLQRSALNKKGLCDYVINVASGCLHGCSFCYVPSTPAIRTRQAHLLKKGVKNPQMDWGDYLFIRENIPEKLDLILSRKRVWHNTDAGKGVVMMCSGTDPYQNPEVAKITRESVKTLLKYDKRIRILTRSPLWVNDLDILVHPNVTVGMSLPHLNDQLSRKIERSSPPPSQRYKALMSGHRAGCRVYIAAAPTHPSMGVEDFRYFLEKVVFIQPEVIFWEPINARGTNGKRMLSEGLDFVSKITTKQDWAENFIKQWKNLESAAELAGCKELIHIWPDPELVKYVESSKVSQWLYKPTVESWSKH